jgi:hypothetical protein
MILIQTNRRLAFLGVLINSIHPCEEGDMQNVGIIFILNCDVYFSVNTVFNKTTPKVAQLLENFRKNILKLLRLIASLS